MSNLKGAFLQSIPMQKIYSLLRDNKQTGPYTLEELVDLNLKPFDLIWIEGKSGGWSYPSEIDALKPFLADPQTKESTPIQKSNEPVEVTDPAATTSFVNEGVANKSEATNKARHIYISFPTSSALGKTTISNSTTTNFSSPVVEEESPEAKLERKAQELRNKIQAFSEGKKEPKEDNELDTKYSRSLDDIKEEYSDWLHQQKKKKTIPYKKILPGLVGVGFIFFTGQFIADKFLSGKTANDVAIQKTEVATPGALSVNKEGLKNTLPAKKKLSKKKSSTRTLTTISKQPGTSTNSVDDYIDSLKQVERRNAERSNDYDSDGNVTQGERSNPVINTSAKETNTRSASSKESSAAFAQLVQLSESTSSEGAKLTIYNNSDRFLNFVAVDVYYYKANDKLLQRKTLYFHNISPKSSSPLYVPELKRAASVQYQMGLISTDSGLFYAKQ